MNKFLYQVKKNKVAYYFIAPTLIGMLIMHLLPIVQGFWMAFLKLDLYTLDQYLGAPGVYFKNFQDIFSASSGIRDGLRDAARNTLIYTIIVTVGQIGMGMIVALLLNKEFRGRALVRTLFMFSWIVPTYVTGLLWGFMWQRSTGVINILLVDVFHLLSAKPFWLSGINTIFAIIIPTIWRYWPLSMLMLLAGLQNIPESMYEAADIDGANDWQKFWRITWPLLKPVWAILILFGLIYNVYSFNIVIMMFGNGGGFPGSWGDLMMTSIFRNSFQQYNFGLGAATSVMLMMIMIGVVQLWYRFYKESEDIY